MLNDYIMFPYEYILNEILNKGAKTTNRTGVTTRTMYNVVCEYDLTTYFPLVTRRKMPFKSIVAELLWILSGSTNNDDLVKLGCKFWSPWVDTNIEENRIFYNAHPNYPLGHLGPIYGWQLRHFGADYDTYLASKNTFGEWMYQGRGHDQLTWLINEIKTNPYSRRLVVSYWNPPDISKMRLAPCHVMLKINLDVVTKSMALTLFQRSGDWPIGVPCNVAQYSLLCHLLAAVTGYNAVGFTHIVNDAHIYENQVPAVQEYLMRNGVPSSPVLKIPIKDNILDYTINDFELNNYEPLPKLEIPVVV